MPGFFEKGNHPGPNLSPLRSVRGKLKGSAAETPASTHREERRLPGQEQAQVQDWIVTGREEENGISLKKKNDESS